MKQLISIQEIHNLETYLTLFTVWKVRFWWRNGPVLYFAQIFCNIRPLWRKWGPINCVETALIIIRYSPRVNKKYSCLIWNIGQWHYFFSPTLFQEFSSFSVLLVDLLTLINHNSFMGPVLTYNQLFLWIM